MSEGKKFDSEKLRMDLIPVSTLNGLAEVLTYGAQKYGTNNWQGLSDFNNRFYGALLRHLIAWRSGEEIDTESGLHHLKHALANICFLLDHQSNSKAMNVNPSWEEVREWKGYIQCSCGTLLKTQQETREHWQNGHFNNLPRFK